MIHLILKKLKWLLYAKMYSQKLEPQCFIAEGIDGRWYPQKIIILYI